MKKIISVILIVILSLMSNTIFAANYTEEDMLLRDTVEGSDGKIYIAQGQPVMVENTATGLISQEPFIGNDGNEYPAGTQMIVVNADGLSGTTKEYSSITLNDTSIQGRGDINELIVQVLAEPVIDNGDRGAETPSFQIQEYLGDIANSAEEYHDKIISEIDRIGMTVEELTAYCGFESVEAFENFTEALYNEEYGEVMQRVPEYNSETGELIFKDVEGSILVVTGATGKEWAEFVKLYSVQGDGELDLFEIIKQLRDEEDVEFIPENPEAPPAGTWSDSQEATVSASVWSEKYDVERAIPTSEDVFGSISASNMSWSYNVVAKNDSESATVTATLFWEPYEYKWTETQTYTTKNASGDKVTKTKTIEHSTIRYRHSSTESVTGTYTTHYFSVQNAQMNTLSGGSVSNESVGTIASMGASGASGSITRDGGIYMTSGISTASIIVYAQTYADAVGKAQGIIANRIKAVSYVKNDELNITGTVLTGQTKVGETFADDPYTSPSSLNSPSNYSISASGVQMIPSDKANDLYKSSASATYTQVGGFDGASTYSKGANPDDVFVHTPVVNTANITYVSPFINQKINIDDSRTYLMLDETFKITIPDDGTHITAKGYNTRTYNSYQAVPAQATNWGKIKDIKLPFDAYLHMGEQLKIVKAGTWLSDLGYAGTETSYTFTIPVWATEGTGLIETRVVAENEVNYSTGTSYTAGRTQDTANTDPNKYVATKIIPVEVIGKIYDLRVSSTNDPGWTSIYSWKNKTTYIAADEFPFGAQGQNRNTAYKYAPKLGYTFVFDFKTKGTKSNNIDVSVKPEGFYFVSRDGKTTREVDLYYNTTAKKNIKIDLADNNVNLTVKLREGYMRVVAQELIDSTRIYNNKYNYSLGVNVGTFAKMNLPHSLRLCYNNFAEYINKLYGKGSTEGTISTDAGERDTVIGSVGHWYAGYRLPASTRAIPAGSNINDAVKNNSFLTDGYIVVKFGIKTLYKNDVGNYPYLQYMGPEAMNEGDNTGELIVDWTKGGNQEITLPNGKPAQVPIGSVAIFDASLRSSSDSEVGGTH